MNICLISRQYPPETAEGGIGTYTYNLAHGLAKLGHTVHVIAQAVGYARNCMDKEVHVHRISQMPIVPFVRGLLRNTLVYSYQVFRKLRAINCEFDIAEVPEWGAEGYVQSISQNPPLVTRLHTPLFLIKQLLNQEMMARDKIGDFLERKQTKNSISISSPTKALAEIVSNRWNIDPSYISVIPNGINIENVKSTKPESNLIDSEYLVFIGSLSPVKGVHILARALPMVFARYPNLKIVFIGEDKVYGNGTMSEFILRLNRNYKENIIFTGFEPGEKKFSLIKHSKLVVLPSLWENFPYTCVESMVLGKAVIGTKNTGFEEIIEEGKSGFLVDPNNHKALQRKIIECLENEDKVKSVEKSAQKRADDFDMQIISRRMVQFYKATLELLQA